MREVAGSTPGLDFYLFNGSDSMSIWMSGVGSTATSHELGHTRVKLQLSLNTLGAERR
jgi:hypothetical protein